jgi:arylsulfatase A-like enzyme
MKAIPLVLCVVWVVSQVVKGAEVPPRPNILFIIFDDWSREHAGVYGCDWVKTPNFDRIAHEGVLFNNAFTSNPKCSPCRASILTGRNTWQLKEAVSHFGIFPAEFQTYPDLLEKSGYAVGLTGKGWAPGDFKTAAHRTRNPAGPSFDQLKQQVPTTDIAKTDYPGNFAAFLKKREKGQPFCFWMGFHEPHRPYELGSGVRLGKKLEDVKVPPYLPDFRAVRSDLADYSIEVEWGDKQIGRALKILEDAGELDNTLVIVTSDHGMPFPFVKGQIHEDAFHLPMAMRWPKGIKAGRVVDDFLNVRDLAPTYMELAGLQPHPQMTGKSLVNILKSEKSGWIENRDVMLTGKERHDIGRPHDWGYPARAIRTKEFLYVHNFHPERWPVGDPETDFGNCDPGPTKEVIKLLGGYFFDISFGKRPADELYDIVHDPRCMNNLANDLYYAPKMEELKYKMMSMLKDDQDPRATGQAEEIETYKYTGKRDKGYEQWLESQEARIEADEKLKAAEKPVKAGKRAAGSTPN